MAQGGRRTVTSAPRRANAPPNGPEDARPSAWTASVSKEKEASAPTRSRDNRGSARLGA